MKGTTRNKLGIYLLMFMTWLLGFSVGYYTAAARAAAMVKAFLDGDGR